MKINSQLCEKEILFVLVGEKLYISQLRMHAHDYRVLQLQQSYSSDCTSLIIKVMNPN